MVGMVPLEPLDPPAGVVPHRRRLTTCLRQQRIRLPQVTPQAGVQEPRLHARFAVALGGLDRLVDQGVRRVVAALAVADQQGQRGVQQRLQGRRGWPPGQQLRHAPRGTEMPQHLERQRLDAGAQARSDLRQDVGQRPSLLYGQHAAGHVVQLLGQGGRQTGRRKR